MTMMVLPMQSEIRAPSGFKLTSGTSKVVFMVLLPHVTPKSAFSRFVSVVVSFETFPAAASEWVRLHRSM